VVVVDNSCDPAEVAALDGIADVILAPDTNLGYARAINLGRRSCKGETLVVSNPDVTFGKGALDRLNAELNGDVAVAGPALYWDDAFQWNLPPADLNTTLEKVDEVLASRADNWHEQRDRRRIRKRLAFWSLTETTRVRALSGAIMAIRAADFDAIEGFDERFHLYFEEIDFLRRMTERGKRIAYVPDAKCRHLYNQSAGHDSASAGADYARSEMQYLEKWSGPFAARLLKRLERAPGPAKAQLLDGSISVAGDKRLIEISPLPSFATAAGCFMPRAGTVELPPDVWRTVRTPLYFRIVEVESFS
jgi:GT2 family glycosyltransferase